MRTAGQGARLARACDRRMLEVARALDGYTNGIVSSRFFSSHAGTARPFERRNAGL